MNQEEILNMPAGTKMNQLIWWKVFDMEPEPPNNNMLLLPDYSKEVAPAWRVVNAFAVEPFAWHIESINLLGGQIKWWACLWGDMPDGSIAEFSAEAETMSLAVCRVALLKVAGSNKA